MRRFLVLMLICLLPLRAWAGDAMAVQMIPKGNALEQTVVAEGTSATQGDCHSQSNNPAGLAADASGSSGTPMAPDCGKCVACDLCHASGVPASKAVVAFSLIHGQQLATRTSAFVSADALRQFKPPIL